MYALSAPERIAKKLQYDRARSDEKRRVTEQKKRQRYELVKQKKVIVVKLFTEGYSRGAIASATELPFTSVTKIIRNSKVKEGDAR